MKTQKTAYHWINDNIKINFPVSKAVAGLMRDCERLDLEKDRYGDAG